MQVLKLNFNNPKEFLDVIDIAIRILRSGGSVVYPTDTIYGLGVDATNEEAVRRIFKIKKRSMTKALPIIVSSVEMARKAAYIDKKKEGILRKIWPGPITVVLQKKSILPNALTGGIDTVGVRIPDSRIAAILVESLGLPITATSANISGEEPDANIYHIIECFSQEVSRPELILDAGILPASDPSTVVDWTTDKLKILRAGPVKKNQLLSILGN